MQRFTIIAAGFVSVAFASKVVNLRNEMCSRASRSKLRTFEWKVSNSQYTVPGPGRGLPLKQYEGLRLSLIELIEPKSGN